MDNSPLLVFSDLDDTLFQTRHKCQGPGPFVPVAYDRENAPLSFQGPRQRRLLALLQHAVWVPVTGRNSDALNRVTGHRFDWCKVTSHGAMRVDAEDRILPDWQPVLETALGLWEPRLVEAMAVINQGLTDYTGRYRTTLVMDHNYPMYLSLKGEADALDAAQPLIADCWPAEGCVHRNGRNVALLPPFASKKDAVIMLIQRFSEENACLPTTVGLGDSLTDTPFLRECDFALTPRHSQIHNELFV